MSAATELFKKMVLEQEEKEKAEKQGDPWRTEFHIAPLTGWLNDPNGLCQYQGKYCFFFQYSPFSAKGGLKFWGKYTSGNLLDWTYEGAVLFPDTPWDCHGVYSGSALTDDGELELFYTGNVKLDGEYDYIEKGREAYVVCTKSRDGKKFGPKERLLGPGDYPGDYTAHIRDPKVWKEGDRYYMVLGGRKKEEKGAVLLYGSRDKKSWEFLREISTPEPFGYMWECPDLFELEGQKILSVSPQGVEREEFRYQNLYQSGYFPVEEGWRVLEEEFVQWDMGFDFYAPQTFLDQKGRRLLTAWAGLPDIEAEYRNPTVERGWQHVLTVPRELTWEKGRVKQYPVEETEGLRGSEVSFDREGNAKTQTPGFDLEICGLQKKEFEILLEEECRICWKAGVFSLNFSGDLGAGRKERKARIEEVKSLRILADTSILEIYVNHGETCFTTRYYPKGKGRKIQIRGIEAENINLYEIKNRK